MRKIHKKNPKNSNNGKERTGINVLAPKLYIYIIRLTFSTVVLLCELCFAAFLIVSETITIRTHTKQTHKHFTHLFSIFLSDILDFIYM